MIMITTTYDMCISASYLLSILPWVFFSLNAVRSIYIYIYIYICIHIQFCPGFLVFERCTRVVEVCANAKRGLLKSNLAEEAY